MHAECNAFGNGSWGPNLCIPDGDGKCVCIGKGLLETDRGAPIYANPMGMENAFVFARGWRSIGQGVVGPVWVLKTCIRILSKTFGLYTDISGPRGWNLVYTFLIRNQVK